MSKRYRYIMVGGFLGAGKTTAIQSLAQHLTDTGQRVGLICNDQSTGLVDTALLRSKGFSVEEITGGCFCCRFDSLLEAAQNLTSDSAPDLFLAEPVGSCTDLVATVSYPLRRIYGDRFSVAPLSVVVDPGRAARIFGLTQGGHFSEKVTYVYRKQLEEADLIVINKCDASPPEILDRVVLAINEAFPHAKTFVCSAKYGTNLEPWFKSLLSEEIPVSRPLEINYDTYAEGEALLGWLNCTVRLKTDQPLTAIAHSWPWLMTSVIVWSTKVDVLHISRQRSIPTTVVVHFQSLVSLKTMTNLTYVSLCSITLTADRW